MIRFEQAEFIQQNENVFEVYEKRFYEVLRLFAKNTLLQIVASSIWFELIELTESYEEKDYSKLLLKKTDILFSQVEELQNNDKLEAIKKSILEMIKECNNKEIL